MMALHIFYTDFVGRAIMSGDPNAAAGSQDYAKYDLGIRIGSQVSPYIFSFGFVSLVILYQYVSLLS